MFWVKKALVKESVRDLRTLQHTRLGMWSSDEFQQKEKQLINRIQLLEPPKKTDVESEYTRSWNFLKSGRRAKKRGK